MGYENFPSEILTRHDLAQICLVSWLKDYTVYTSTKN